MSGLHPSGALAQLQLEFENIGPAGATIDAADFPMVHAFVRVRDNGSNVRIDKSNLLIVEDNLSTRALAIGEANGAGFQKVSWISRLRGVQRDSAFPGQDVFMNDAEFVVTYNGKLGRRSCLHRRNDLIQLRFSSNFGELRNSLPDVYFGEHAPGETDSIVVQLRTLSAAIVDGKEQLVQIDSVRTFSEHFSYQWLGSLSDDTPPPTKITNLIHRIRVFYHPKTSGYLYDSLTVFYEGGGQEKIYLIGNTFSVPDSSSLQLLEPRGGEILAPCQDVDIRWTGNISRLPVTLSVTTNGGKRWDTLVSTTDTVYRWRTPAIDAPEVRFRISQPLQRSNVIELADETTSVYKLAFRGDSKTLLSAYASGNIVEWDVAARRVLQRFNAGSAAWPDEAIVTLGMEYLASDRFVGIHRHSGSGRNYINIFTSGNANPVRSVDIENGFSVRSATVDAARGLVYLVPESGLDVLVYDVNAGSFNRRSFDLPVTALAISNSKDIAVAALLNGEIRLMKLTDFSTIETLDFKTRPIILQMAVSPDAALLAIGTQAPELTIQGSGTAEVHVIDVASGQIIRTLRKSGSDPVAFAFNSTARFLAMGFEGTPQTKVLNLPENKDEGEIVGHPNKLSDMRFAANGYLLATSSLSNLANLKMRTFSFPERDSNATFIRIAGPNIALAEADVPPTLIGVNRNVTIERTLCNKGDALVDLETLRLESGLHFSLAQNFERDTLLPGECITVAVTFNPRDTGTIEDKLIFSSCNTDYIIPLESRGLNRNIGLLANGFDFGTLCVGAEEIVEVDLLRNDDPEPLLINGLFISNSATSPLSILDFAGDTVLQAGEVLRVRFRYSPRAVGEDVRNVTISHSDQRNVFATLTLRSEGEGAVMEYSHTDLRFIPEIPVRTFRITNNSATPVRISEASISAPEEYRFVTALPIDLASGESAVLEVEWIGSGATPGNAELTTNIAPCAARQVIKLGPYSASSVLRIPVVEADPTGEARIPILFSNSEQQEYKGERFFEAEFSVNPRLFLPQSVSSPHGTGDIIRNEIVNGLRIIGIRVSGNFPKSGTAATIIGLPGLAETLSSPLTLNSAALFWSSAVPSTVQNGELRIAAKDTVRRIIQRSSVTLLNSYPNPARETFTLDLYAPEGGMAVFELVDMLGQATGIHEERILATGRSSHEFIVHGLAPGAYRLRVQIGTEMYSRSIVIGK